MTKKNYTHLHLRKHTYYVRIAIPQKFWNIVKKKEICYTLGTKDYLTAIHLLKKETFKIELLFKWLGKLNMEIKNNTVYLTPAELKQMLSFQLRKIDDFLEDKEYLIKMEVEVENCITSDLGLDNSKEDALVDTDTVKVFKRDDPVNGIPLFHTNQIIQKRENNLFYEFLDWLDKRPATPLTTRHLIREIKQKNTSFLLPRDYFGITGTAFSFYSHLLELDRYVDDQVKQIRGEISSVPTTKLIETLKEAMKLQKYNEINQTLKTQTKWEDVFEDMTRPSKKDKTVKSGTLIQKKKCIAVIMELIEKQYVEDITFEDCEIISRDVYRIPKKWQEKYKDKTLREVLLPPENEKDALSIASVSKYLTMFKEFLSYCRKHKKIAEDLAGCIEKPYYDRTENTYLPFTPEELEKIFDPKTFCYYYKRDKDNPSFWVPLLSLFSGARLNEMCQIRLEDIMEEKGITFIQTKDASSGHKLQSLKNKGSKRRIPIHPVLKQLGFLDFIKKQKRAKQEWLFPSLLRQYHPKNKFGRKVSRDFATYLTKLGITDTKKVFHSLRHTVRPKLRDECDLSIEYIDALCGWESGSRNAGAVNYSHKDTIPIEKLYTMLSKLSYPNIDFKEMKDRMKRISYRSPE